MREAERQRKAVEAIRKAGGWVFYDYECSEDGGTVVGAEPPAPAWLRKLVGDDFFSDVVGVLVDSADDGDLALNHVSGLTELEWLWILGTQDTGEHIEELRRALPNCDVQWVTSVRKRQPNNKP